MKYRSDSELSQKVCEHIGWRFESKPIETCQKEDQVFVKGTALKPSEWVALDGYNGKTMELDGQTVTLSITNTPKRIKKGYF